MTKRQKVRDNRPIRDIDFNDWIGGMNAHKFATRQQVVAFAHVQLREQIVPLMEETAFQVVALYLKQRKRRRWYRRLWRWLGTRLRPVEMEPVEHPVADLAEDTDDEPVVEPSEERERPRSCVVCASVQLEPLTEKGGLLCHNGHLVEEAPSE